MDEHLRELERNVVQRAAPERSLRAMLGVAD